MTVIINGPMDPDGPAPPDGVAVAVGIVTETGLKASTLGNWTKYTETNYNNTITTAKYNVFIVEPGAYWVLVSTV